MESSARYEVVFKGQVLPGATAQSVRGRITETNLMSPLNAAGIIFDGSLMVLYSSASKPLAFRTLKKFREAGLECWVRKKTEAPSAALLVTQKGFMVNVIAVILVLLSGLVMLRLLLD